MKTMRYIFSIFLLMLAVVADAQQLRQEAFELINLDYPGLEKVKAACSRQKWEAAAQELLNYYRSRTGITHPDIDLKNLTISKEEQKWADDALEHTFFVHKGYQPSYNYGKDINWEYWPVKDNELRWQLHRHKWFTPMGKAYRISGDEKYAKEWVHQYMDWVQKNPLVNMKQFAGPDLPVSFVLLRIGVYSGVPDRVYRQLSPSWRTSPEKLFCRR